MGNSSGDDATSGITDKIGDSTKFAYAALGMIGMTLMQKLEECKSVTLTLQCHKPRSEKPHKPLNKVII